MLSSHRSESIARCGALAISRTKSRDQVSTSAEPPASAAERARANILEVATAEFAEYGYSGARVDEIAAKTQTSKRMIYYYFRDKEGLFTAVLEEGYRQMRALERALDVDKLDPESAMRALVAGTFEYQAAHEQFVRLVVVENIHRGVHLEKTGIAGSLGGGALQTLSGIYDRGVAAGVFRPGVSPLHLHMTISALSFFNVSNTATFSLIFNHDMKSPEALAERRDIVVETVLRFLRQP
jgi:AcrR family transcriptional regulator